MKTSIHQALKSTHVSFVSGGEARIGRENDYPYFVLSGFGNLDKPGRNEFGPVVVKSKDVWPTIRNFDWLDFCYGAGGYGCQNAEEAEAVCKSLRAEAARRELEQMEWEDEQDRFWKASRKAYALPMIALLLCLTSAGCRSSGVAKTPSHRQMVDEMLDDAVSSVRGLTGVEVKPAIVYADKPFPQGWFAKREGNEITISPLHPLSRAELYDTLVHEMLHITTASPVSSVTFKKGDPDLEPALVMQACSEAISWRYAAELTAKRFGKSPVYRWDYIPRSIAPREMIVHMVMEQPEAVLSAAREIEVARGIVRGCLKAMARGT